MVSLMSLTTQYIYSFGSRESFADPSVAMSNVDIAFSLNYCYDNPVVKMVLYQTGTTDTSETEEMDEVLVSAQRFDQKRKYSPRQIEVVSAKKLSELQPATLGDALINTGQVFVQKSQMGGSSPVLRGFEASRVLLVVDGVRMNNATYRAGHLQDIITIDPQILDRMEVNFGSGSTLFGSDAMGGVLYFKTKTPTTGKKQLLPYAGVRYQSASISSISNAGFRLQMPKWGLMVSATQSNFGDLRTGSKNYSDIDTFGYRSWYVGRINNRDTLLRNEDPQKQVGTGYSQTDLFAKLLVKTGGINHILNVQSSQADLIPRYDRLTEFSQQNGRVIPTFGRWDYAPQNRSFISYQAEQGSAEHRQRLTLARQETQVGRITRNFRSNTQRSQMDTVVMATVNYDRSDKISNRLRLNTGLEYVNNRVRSTGINTNILTGTESITKARYADSGARTNMTSVYAQLLGDLPRWKANVQGGARYTRYDLQANYSIRNPWKLPYNSIEFANNTSSFDVGLNKEIGKIAIVKVSVNQAFRNPNVDDMTKVFDSKPAVKLLVPSPNLQAERSTTFDLGILMSKSEKFVLEAGVYQSVIANLLLDQVGTSNGEDSVEYDGRLTPVYQLKNMAEGSISGFYTNAKVKIMDGIWWSGSLNYTRGLYRAGTNSSEVWQPLDHIPPMYGQTSIKWTSRQGFGEVQYLFNGEKKAEDYSSSGEDNQDKQPIGMADIDGDGKPDGYNPAWGIWTIRGGYRLPKGFSVQLAVENVLDLHYRYFASGMSASGRNVLLSVKWDLSELKTAN